MAPATSRGADSRPATYKLVREVPVETGYDVVVAGGGMAGASAAICAGRLGAKVLLVEEETGCLGGMATSGMVTQFGPMANGERNLVAGLMLEVVEAMHKRNLLGPAGDSGMVAQEQCGLGALRNWRASS